MAKHLIYSLTNRGLFSEILNLNLAKIYAEKNGLEFIVNTYNWNSKYQLGWQDYFVKTFKVINQKNSAQIFAEGKNHKISLWGLKTDFFKEINHIYFNYLNKNFKKKHNCFLTDDIFYNMRLDQFINSVDLNFSFFSSSLKEFYIYNEDIKTKFLKMRSQIGLTNKNYIGVHIRRGDKITSKEMKNILIDEYIYQIIAKRDISRNIYISTDDSSIIDNINEKLKNNFNIYHNIFNKQSGFQEKSFNHLKKDQVYQQTLLTLFDVDLLINSSFFIGTYSSNLSRIVPCYLGLENSISLDSVWKIVG